MSTLVVRADATGAIGAGHFMRSLALAEAWCASGGESSFLSRCESQAIRARAEASGMTVLPLTGSGGSEADLRESLDLLQRLDRGTGECWLCTDGYFFSAEYHAAIRAEGWPLLVIDDTAHLSAYHASVLLNQQIGAEPTHYATDADTVLLLGPDYLLLRSEFIEKGAQQARHPAVARRILVTFGGSDSHNMTVRAIRALEGMTDPRLEAVVVVGAVNQHRAAVERAAAEAAEHMKLRVVRDARNMPDLMEWADMAVSAGGITSWELCYMGVPSLLLITAENQRDTVEGLEAAGAAINGGWGPDLPVERLREAVSGLAYDMDRRASLSGRGRRFVDGRGARRVVEALSRWMEDQAVV